MEFSLFEPRWKHYGISGVPFEDQDRLKLVNHAKNSDISAEEWGNLVISATDVNSCLGPTRFVALCLGIVNGKFTILPLLPLLV